MLLLLLCYFVRIYKALHQVSGGTLNTTIARLPSLENHMRALQP